VRLIGSCTLEAMKSEMSAADMLPSLETNATTMRKFFVDFATRTPERWTSRGSSGIANCSLFCTCTCAMSGLVPCSKLSVMVMLPSLSLSDEK